MGCLSSKTSGNQDVPNERAPLVPPQTTIHPVSLVPDEPRGARGGLATGSFALSSQQMPPPPTRRTPPVATSVFTSLDRQQAFRLDQPDFPLEILQDSFDNVYKLYKETAFANREKIDECITSFKQVLGLHPQLHMRECFRAWKDRIIQPVFKITFTDDRKYVKEIIVKADRGNIPQEIWPAQKFIRELLHGCHLFLDQYQFFQTSIEESFTKIRHTLKNLSSITRNDPLLNRNKDSIRERAEFLLNQYEHVIGIVSRFEEQIRSLMSEIFDSVSVLNN